MADQAINLGGPAPRVAGEANEFASGKFAPVVSAINGGYRAVATVTRPANTTPYSIGDVVGGVLSFANAGEDSEHLLLTSLDMMLNIAAIPAGMAAFRLHLYVATPPSAIADNAAFDLPAGDRASYRGYIDIPAPIDLGATLFAQFDGAVNKHLLMETGTTIYAYLQTLTAFTPAANSEVYTINLRGTPL
jgi:hypothetical protein